MRRRDFTKVVAGAASALPVAAHAQPSTIPVVGYLSCGSPPDSDLIAFRQGLNESGYVEEQNVIVEYRWAEGQQDRLPALAADLVRRQVCVIATYGTPSTLAAKAATATIPIVFVVGADPVELGLVASLSRPEGNATSATWRESAWSSVLGGGTDVRLTRWDQRSRLLSRHCRQHAGRCGHRQSSPDEQCNNDRMPHARLKLFVPAA